MPYEDDGKVRLMRPLDTRSWLREKVGDRMLGNGFTSLFNGDHASCVGFYGPGRHEIASRESETMLWQLGTGQCVGQWVSAMLEAHGLQSDSPEPASRSVGRRSLRPCGNFPRSRLATRSCFRRTTASFWPRTRGRSCLPVCPSDVSRLSDGVWITTGSQV